MIWSSYFIICLFLCYSDKHLGVISLDLFVWYHLQGLPQSWLKRIKTGLNWSWKERGKCTAFLLTLSQDEQLFKAFCELLTGRDMFQSQLNPNQGLARRCTGSNPRGQILSYKHLLKIHGCCQHAHQIISKGICVKCRDRASVNFLPLKFKCLFGAPSLLQYLINSRDQEQEPRIWAKVMVAFFALLKRLYSEMDEVSLRMGLFTSGGLCPWVLWIQDASVDWGMLSSRLIELFLS